MKHLTVRLAIVAAGLVTAPNLASAAPAVTTDSTNLRAGPAFDFPVVDRIPAEVRVNVHGCVRGYRWCDVSWRDARGWLPGSELAHLEGGRRVTFVEYGPRIRLPVVAFSFDTYWDRHYRGRPWYGERNRWRTVWREHDRGEGRSSERFRDRRDSSVETRTDRDRRDSRIETRTDRRQVEQLERRDVDRGRNIDRDRRTSRDEQRPNVRTGRGDWRERGETRAYRPDESPGARRDGDRGRRPDAMPDRGRAAEPAVRERGPGGGRDGGPAGGGPLGGPGERKSN